MNTEIRTPDLAALGGGRLAYIRPMTAGQAKDLFPSMPEVAPELHLWALLAADGSPIMLADTREAVEMNAHDHDLETVSLH